jgi:hypothetical protein
MASGHVNRAERPNTWAHRPFCTLEKFLPTRSRSLIASPLSSRLCLYEAATVIMTRIKLPLDLKVGAAKIAKRSGTNKARLALARELAVI